MEKSLDILFDEWLAYVDEYLERNDDDYMSWSKYAEAYGGVRREVANAYLATSINEEAGEFCGC
jgi:hypothetical protein